MKIIISILLVFFITNIIAQPVPKGTIVTDLILNSNNGNRMVLSYENPVNVTNLEWVLFPCYGSIQWWVTRNSVPVPGAKNNSCSSTWNADNGDQSVCEVTSPKIATYYALLNGSGEFPEYPGVTAKFDFLLTSESDPSYGQIIPVPGNGGTVDATALSQLKSGQKQQVTMKFVGTGNPNDTYAAYVFQGNLAENTGYSRYSACGIQLFMQPAAAANVQITNEGDIFTAVVSNLDPVKASQLAVIVERDGGYMAAYQVVQLNGISSILSQCSVLLIILAILFN